jgi:hypothetical protein
MELASAAGFEDNPARVIDRYNWTRSSAQASTSFEGAEHLELIGPASVLLPQLLDGLALATRP